MRLRRARLIDKPKFPQHGTKLKHVPGATRKWKDWRGKKIKVWWDPMQPAPEWECGTREVWRVADESLVAMGVHMPPPGHPVLCRHQIEFGW